MEILKPPIICIGKTRYRQNPVKEQDRSFSPEIDGEIVYEDDVECLDGLNFTSYNGGYSLALPVANAYYKYIIGKKGETKRRIEAETKTRIQIPTIEKDGNVILISGHEKAPVASAKRRLDVIVANQRPRQPFTHFLAFPLNTAAIEFRVGEFKIDVLRECGEERGLDSTIFQSPAKMHLTLGTLVLLSKTEIDEAVQLLQICHQQVIQAMLGEGGMQIHVKGLEYMNDDPAEVDVLYAKVCSPNKPEMLSKLSNCIKERFTSAGIMNGDFDSVKLHMTVMNTLIRRDQGPSAPADERRQIKDRESFDARRVLQLFGEYDFGRCEISSLDLCRRYGVQCDGYYQKISSVNLY